jgi:hypothetical protein
MSWIVKQFLYLVGFFFVNNINRFTRMTHAENVIGKLTSSNATYLVRIERAF